MCEVVQEGSVGGGGVCTRGWYRDSCVRVGRPIHKRKFMDTGRFELSRCVPLIPHSPQERKDGVEPACVVLVPVRDDDVGYVGFIWVRELAGVEKCGFELRDVGVLAFASVDERVRVALADKIGVCSLKCEFSWILC